MNPVMYLIASTVVEMSHGKFGAQCGHAAVEAYRLSTPSMVNQWMLGGHYSKVVLGAVYLQVAERYINDRGFKTALIIDEGRTEIDALTPTVIGVEIVDKDSAHVKATFGEFKLYKPPPVKPEVVIVEAGDRLNPDDFEKIRASADPASAARSIIEFKKPMPRSPWWRRDQ